MLTIPCATQGATEAAIEAIPTIKIQAEHYQSEGGGRRGHAELSCPICLNDLAIGDEVRDLKCKHLFHKQVRHSKHYAVTLVTIRLFGAVC